MNDRFIVAQANTTGTAQEAQKRPVKVVKVTKPSDGQAITIELSHDQPTKIDLTAIASENFTLARIGEKLVFQFDNRSTLTIEPYSTNVASPDVTFEVSPGRVVDVTEFATLFSIATGQSELPAVGKPGAQASGADFSNPSVEPLDTPDRHEAFGPLPLSQDFLPNWNTNLAEPRVLVAMALNLGGAGSDTGGIDTENPTVTVNIVDGALSDGDPSSVVAFTFSEAPGASFTESDIQVSAGLTLVAGSLTMVDATHYTATVTAADGFTGSATVSLAAGSYTDAALNLGGAGSDTVSIDTENPTATVNIVDGALSDGDFSSVVTFTFSEPPGASFTESDIQVSAGLTLVAGFSGGGVFTPTSTEVRP